MGVADTGSSPDKARRRRYKRRRRGVGKAAVRLVGPSLLRLLAATWRVEELDREHLDEVLRSAPGHVMALWHGRMIVGLPRHAHRGWHVLVSPSEDGDVSTLLLGRFGYEVIRGSTSRGGARALRQLLAALRASSAIVITPDGPRGPRHSMNVGPAWIASVTGYPIVPCGFVASAAWRMQSWDAFTVPKPFTRVALVYGEPVRVSRRAEREELEEASRLLRERMLAAEERGFAHLGAGVDW